MSTGYTALNHEVEWIHDYLGRLEQMKTEIGDFDYNYVGNSPLINDIDLPNGNESDYDWYAESQGRFLKEIDNNDGGTTQSKFTYYYDGDGRMNKQTRANTYYGTAFPIDYEYTHDNVFQLKKVVEKYGSTTLYTNTWSYDDAGNRTTKNEYGGTVNAFHNANNQVTSTTISEAYTFTYDDNGNMLRKTGSIATGIAEQAYSWDAENRLVYLTRRQTAGSDSNGDYRLWFSYNGLGQRYKMQKQKRVSGSWSSSGFSPEYYVWADGEIVQKRVGGTSGFAVKSNYYPRGESRHTGTGSGNKSDFYYNIDHLGTVYEMTDSTGAVKAAYKYTSWGERTAKSTNTMECEFGFTGHWLDDFSGLHLAWYRAYDAELGRWLKRDPIMEQGGINVYGYVGNRPGARYDPFGLDPTDSECLGRFLDENGRVKPGTGVDFHLHTKKVDKNPNAFPHNHPDDDCTLTCMAHGNSGSVLDQTGYESGDPTHAEVPRLTPRKFVRLLKRKYKAAYNSADLIVLFACDTGKGANSFAQQVASLTGKAVAAPTDRYNAKSRTVSNGGEFKVFRK